MNTLVLEIVTIWGKNEVGLLHAYGVTHKNEFQMNIKKLKTCIFIYTYMCVYMILSYLSISKSTYIKEKRSKT